MIDETIKQFRIKNNMTQSQLAKRLGITRSSVNAWEMGISVPTTQYLVELSLIFQVSTDYLLGLDKKATLDISGLTPKDMDVLYPLVQHLRSLNQEKEE